MDLCFQSKNVSPNNLTDVIFWNNFLALVFIFHFFLFKNKKKKKSPISTLISGIKFTKEKKT